MTSYDNTKSLLNAALTRAGRNNEQQRLGVYKAAIAAVDKLPEETRPRYREQLNRAIFELEQEFGTFDAGTAGNTVKTAKVEAPGASDTDFNRAPVVGRHDEIPEPETFTTRNAGHAPSHQEPGQVDNIDILEGVETERSRREVAPSSGRMKWLLLAVAAILLVLLAGWFAWNSVLGTTATSSGSGSSEPVAQAESGETLVLVDDRFPDNLSNWQRTVAGGQDSALAFADFLDDGELIVKDSLNLYNSSLLPVNTDSVYVMKVKFQLVEDGQWPSLAAGVATFDKDGAVLTSAPGTHRYFLSTGELERPAGIKPGEVFEVSGIITDVGDESHFQFRAGTETVKLALLFRAPENAAKLAIKEVSFVQASD